MSDYFPQEIILQILHKLPIKSLVRCTCVCKTWNSLIKNPSFISTHLTLTISSNTHLLLFRLCYNASEHYILHLDNQQLSQYIVLDFPFKSPTYFNVTSSVNGIICLVNVLVTRTDTFILWNPLIKKSLTISKPFVTFSSHVPYKVFIGFGFDSKTNDYKVLRIVHQVFNEEDVDEAGEEEEEEEEEEEAFMEVELYSLNTNSWKSMTCVAPKHEFYMHHRQAFVNGVVHWIAFQCMGGLVRRNLVLGFEMGDEVFCEIKLPESLANVISMDMFVTKYGDSSISVIENDLSIHFQCHIWVMKEYGVVESWTKLFSFMEVGGGIPTVLGFRKSGEVLLQINDRKIVSYDPQNKGVMDLGLRDQAWEAFVDGYMESLVLLDNANASNDVIEDESDDSMSSMDDLSDNTSDAASNDKVVAV